MINFDKIFNDVKEVLKAGLSEHLVYHNLEHTLYVLDKSILIAEHERISGHELSLIKIAALYHDIGFIKGRDQHEEISCAIAQEDLRIYGMSTADIAKICGMIKATKIPQKPDSLLEKIIADADLEYLGTENFEPISERLYEEILHYNSNISRTEWYKLQVDFMTAHQYHTEFCRNHRDHKKLQNLENINKKLKCLIHEHK
ncbi:MAG TPA: HD domain-containing protein [Anditalea sp.]|nr:HD domain-containing protein [Anditalea sp.]